MKLILANNQSARFKSFYQELSTKTSERFDYSGYKPLLFEFNSPGSLVVHNLETGKTLDEYDGVYINSYLNSYELAASVAIACQALKIPFVNRELGDPPSLSKLSMYTKLAASGVRLPYSLGGTKVAMLMAGDRLNGLEYPAVLKRADADRGIDNYMVRSAAEITGILSGRDDRSIWILQKFVPNKGFYLVSYYDGKPAFCIHRTLEERPDRDASKAHMYKPKGGANASLLDVSGLPPAILSETLQAVKAMNRQIASVDCIYDPIEDLTYILEVNYNPQLVTIETFKDARQQAFTNFLNKKW